VVIWAILLVNTVSGALGLALVRANEEAAAASRAVLRAKGLTPTSGPIGCVLVLMGLCSPVLWVVYAVQVDDWRFAAATLVPFGLGYLSQVVQRGIRKQKQSTPGVRPANVWKG
jgi:hypothetical protein